MNHRGGANGLGHKLLSFWAERQHFSILPNHLNHPRLHLSPLISPKQVENVFGKWKYVKISHEGTKLRCLTPRNRNSQFNKPLTLAANATQVWIFKFQHWKNEKIWSLCVESVSTRRHFRKQLAWLLIALRSALGWHEKRGCELGELKPWRVI